METAKFLIPLVCHSSTLAKNKSNKAVGVWEWILPNGKKNQIPNSIKINKFHSKRKNVCFN